MLEHLEAWAPAITLASTITAVVAAWFSKASASATQKSSKANLILDIDRELREFKWIHTHLRHGTWHEAVDESDGEAWSALDSYMGIFERIKIFLDDGLLELGQVQTIYGYRVENIIHEPDIVDRKLREEAAYWQLFIALMDDLGLQLQPAR